MGQPPGWSEGREAEEQAVEKDRILACRDLGSTRPATHPALARCARVAALLDVIHTPDHVKQGRLFQGQGQNQRQHPAQVQATLNIRPPTR